jgi:hypothetical protein
MEGNHHGTNNVMETGMKGKKLELGGQKERETRPPKNGVAPKNSMPNSAGGDGDP